MRELEIIYFESNFIRWNSANEEERYYTCWIEKEYKREVREDQWRLF